MRLITWNLADFGRTVNHLETEKSLLVKKNEDFVPFSSRTITSGGQITDKSLQRTLPVYLGFAFSFQKANLRNCSNEGSEPIRSVWAEKKLEVQQ